MAPRSCWLLSPSSSIRNCFSYSTTVTCQISVGCCSLPLTIPSLSPTWSLKLEFHQELSPSPNVVLNRAMIALGAVGLLLTIPSTRNYSLFHLPGISSFFSIDTFFLHPGDRSIFPLSLVLKLETQPSPLSLAHGQKSWHCLLRPAGKWSPPSQSSSMVYFHFVQMLFNHICRPLWSCHL